MKIAYLVNQYPKVSHTFIRREIVALEAEGVKVERYSIRGAPDELVDEKDLAEIPRSRIILSGGMARLVLSAIRAMVGNPLAFFKATRLAVQIGWTSERGLLVHMIYLAEACVLLDWSRESNVQHVHVHFGTNSAAVAMLCRELGGVTYSFTCHGPEEFDKASLISLSEKIKRASFVVGISNFGRSQLFRYCDHSQWNKIRAIRCGLDGEFLEDELHPVSDTPQLVCVGRLGEQKGQLLLIEAAARLRKDGADFRLILVGDGEMRGEIERLIRDQQIEDCVTITGWVDGATVRQHLHQSRALVLPSFAEGLPIVIMEALALGRPVLSTYVAGIPELVEPGKCGWLVPAGSVDGLVDAMRQVLATPTSRLEAMGREGRRRVQEMHDARINAALLRKTLQEFVDS